MDKMDRAYKTDEAQKREWKKPQLTSLDFSETQDKGGAGSDFVDGVERPGAKGAS